MPVGKKALDRISDGLKRYRTILANARKRDVSGATALLKKATRAAARRKKASKVLFIPPSPVPSPVVAPPLPPASAAKP